MPTTFIRNYLYSVPSQRNDAADLLAATIENKPGNEIINSFRIPSIHRSVMADKAKAVSTRVVSEVRLQG